MSETPALPLLAARGLHSYYGSSHVLHGVDLELAAGEAVALMGRNGMGKSTLLKSLIGLVRPQRGEVRLWGEMVTHTPTYQIARRGVAYVPEGRGIFPNLSVRENLLMSARPGVAGQCDWDLARVMAAFPRLAERLHHRGDQLSGGEQQMLTISRALMTNPSLLILDEATEGLAPLIAREIWQIVRTIRASGMATLLVDKNHVALTDLCDRALILVKGHVVFSGSSHELSGRPELIHQHLGV